jgi:GTP-binding protein EngB required for normal cell division
MFAKSGSRILLPYAPSLASRNQVFENLRRNQRNILLIGRSRTGKSTFKNVLTDPTWIADSLKPYSQTEFPSFDQYSITGTDILINFIDTPGLFQRTQTSSSSPDNQTIMQLIDGYIRSKITQLHFVCFCVSMETNVTTEDLHTVQQFFDFLGPEIRKNACLIITKCESKTEQQLESMCKEAKTNLDFKVLSSQMKQGIFFTGSINRVDWIDTSESIYQQFENICQYRNKLMNLFINVDVKPFDLSSNILARKIKDEIDFRGKTKLK